MLQMKCDGDHSPCLLESLLVDGLLAANSEAATAEAKLDLLQTMAGSQPLIAMFTEGVLRGLDPVSITQLRGASVAAQEVCDEAMRRDFPLRIGRILFLRRRHQASFRRQLLAVECEHLRCARWWILNYVVLLPVALSLNVDFGAVPAWAVAVPACLSFAKVLFKSSFCSPPHSGVEALRGHEAILWEEAAEGVFGRRGRLSMRLWMAACLALPTWAGLSRLLAPELPWLPYLWLLPFSTCTLVPIYRQYRLTRQAGVGLTQAVVTAWIACTVTVTFFLVFDAPRGLVDGCVLYLCGAGGNFGVLLGVLLWAPALVLATVAYPAVFTLVNVYKGWYVSAACGACGLAHQLTVLASLAGLAEPWREAWPLWRFGAWLALAGLLACARLCAELAERQAGGAAARGGEPRPGVQLKGAELFVFPPLVPPTMSGAPFTPNFFTPRWQ